VELSPAGAARPELSRQPEQGTQFLRQAVHPAGGDALVAVCEPIQQRPWTGYRHPSSADLWYLGIIGPGDSVAPALNKK
jgi:hypothetical protein